MKYIPTTLIISLVFFSNVGISFAQTKTASPSPTTKISPTATASPTATLVDKEVKNLRDKIATKVAELRKKSQKAISGEITEIKGANLKIKNEDDETFDIKVDEALTTLYQIAGTTKKDIKLKDLSKGDYIIVTGPLLEKTVNANVIYVDEQFFVKSGKITSLDTDNNTVKVVTSDKDNISLTYTKTFRFQLMDSKTLEIENTLTSKIKEGDTIHFVAKKAEDSKDNSTMALQKALIVPQEYFAGK